MCYRCQGQAAGELSRAQSSPECHLREGSGHRSQFPVYKLVKKHGLLTRQPLWLNVFVRGAAEWVSQE